jgi:uncharacterized membrane protein
MKILKRYSLVAIVLILLVLICLPAGLEAQEVKTDLSLSVLPGDYFNGLQSGKSRTLYVEVRNTGLTNITDIRFKASAPENWLVTFQPDNLAALAPGNNRLVDVDIIPADGRGNYTLNLIAEALETSAAASVYLQVEGGSGYWLWIGVAMAVAMVMGFILVFRRESKK